MAKLKLRSKRLGYYVESERKTIDEKFISKAIAFFHQQHDNFKDFQVVSVESKLKKQWLYFSIEYNPDQDNTFDFTANKTKIKKDINGILTKRLKEIMNTVKYTKLEASLPFDQRYTLRVETKQQLLIDYLENV